MRRLAPLVALVAVGGCGELLTDPTSGASAEAVYRELWEVFDARYAPFAQRGVDWEAAFDRHRPAPDADDDGLFAAASGLLAELDDGHVTLVAPDRPVFVAQRSFREDTHQGELDLGIVVGHTLGGLSRTGAARHGVLEGDVGYVHVAHWGDPIPDLEAVFETLRGRRGVIVDLRHNPGGSFLHGFEFASGFADVKRPAFITWTKTGPGRDALGQRMVWSVEPDGGEPILAPTVVLTNGFTNSAAERTVLGLSALPHVTVVGSPTAGNLGEKVGGQLSNGWRFSVVPQLVEDPAGVSPEGDGIVPDLRVDNTPAEVAQGLDRQLETALAMLWVGEGR